MKNILFIVVFSLLFSGCSGKKVYEMVMDFGRYQGDLTLKKTSISNDLNISYLENNVKSDRTLVLIHGFGANKDNWLELVKQLNGKYHLIIPDLVGDGKSSKPLTIDYTIEIQTKMLHKFLTKFPDKNLNLLDDMTLKSQQINVPTLILWGKEDKIISIKNAYAFADYIPRSKVLVFEGLGHMPMIENAELTAKSIVDFLE